MLFRKKIWSQIRAFDKQITFSSLIGTAAKGYRPGGYIILNVDRLREPMQRVTDAINERINKQFGIVIKYRQKKTEHKVQKLIEPGTTAELNLTRTEFEFTLQPL